MSVGQNQIIENARVLTADYLPNNLVHRDSQRRGIARGLEPVLGNGQPDDMLLYGSPGTGKTAMSKYVVRQLQEEVFVEERYINCFSLKSRFEIFYELLGEKAKVPRASTSTEEVIERFEEKTRKNPMVVIIDEVDQITDDSTLYELSRFNNIGIIFIANDQNVFAHFEDRVRSRLLHINNIRFRDYTKGELTDILKKRRQHGLKKNTITSKQLSKIADRADGDARLAVNSLGRAADVAEKQELDEITDKVIDEAVTDTIDEERIESRDRLNAHQQAVEEVLEDEGPLKMGDLYESYRTQVSDPKSKRTLRRYLGKMEAYDFVKSEGSKRWKQYYLAK